MQYDVTWDMARNQDIAEPAGSWVRAKYVPELDKRMEADGRYGLPSALRGITQSRVLHGSVLAALFALVLSGLQNRPSLLVRNA